MNIISDVCLFDSGVSFHVVNTSAFVSKNRRLTMDRDNALKATKIYPGIDRDAGDVVLKFIDNISGIYGFRMIRGDIGIFQTKYHFKERKADGYLFRVSVQMLSDFARTFDGSIGVCHPGKISHKSDDDIMDILSMLPDNVYVCKPSR